VSFVGRPSAARCVSTGSQSAPAHGGPLRAYRLSRHTTARDFGLFYAGTLYMGQGQTSPRCQGWSAAGSPRRSRHDPAWPVADSRALSRPVAALIGDPGLLGVDVERQVARLGQCSGMTPDGGASRSYDFIARWRGRKMSRATRPPPTPSTTAAGVAQSGVEGKAPGSP
jgi:hypothetical protein